MKEEWKREGRGEAENRRRREEGTKGGREAQRNQQEH